MMDELTIYALPRAGSPPDEGLNLGTSSWRRIDDTMMPARGKLVGAYVNSALIKSEAVTGGHDDGVVPTPRKHHVIQHHVIQHHEIAPTTVASTKSTYCFGSIL